jgi:hypothetical protein
MWPFGVFYCCLVYFPTFWYVVHTKKTRNLIISNRAYFFQLSAFQLASSACRRRRSLSDKKNQKFGNLCLTFCPPEFHLILSGGKEKLFGPTFNECFLNGLQVETRVARFFLTQYTKMGENIPNYHKIT